MNAPAPTNEYAWYEAALRGEFRPLINGRAEPGFYRDRRRDGGEAAVAVWQQDGILCARIGGNGSSVIEASDEFFERVFTRACKCPVSEDDYWAVVEGAPWPDMPPERAHSNLPDDPREALAMELAGEQAEVDAWLRKVGTITTKAAADRAANYADRLAQSQKRADTLHAEAKRPILEQGRAIDAAWKPIQSGFRDLVRRLKEATVPYQLAERQRVEAERARALASGDTTAARQAKVSAGTVGRKIALRTVRTAVVDDPAALAAWLVEHKNPDMLELLQTLANRMVRSGASAPGCSVKETQQAA